MHRRGSKKKLVDTKKVKYVERRAAVVEHPLGQKTVRAVTMNIPISSSLVG